MRTTDTGLGIVGSVLLATALVFSWTPLSLAQEPNPQKTISSRAAACCPKGTKGLQAQISELKARLGKLKAAQKVSADPVGTSTAGLAANANDSTKGSSSYDSMTQPTKPMGAANNGMNIAQASPEASPSGGGEMTHEMGGGGGMEGGMGAGSGANPSTSPSASPMEQHMKGMEQMHGMMHGGESGASPAASPGGMPMEHNMGRKMGEGMGGMGGGGMGGGGMSGGTGGGAQPEASPSGGMGGGMKDDM